MSKNYTITEEERERRRQRMLELKAQGKVGPEFGKLGGRPRKPRASEAVAEAAAKDAEAIIQVFKDGVRADSLKTRLSAANSWIAIEAEEARLKIQEERHDLDIGNASREELIGFLTDALTQGSLAAQFGDIIEGTAVDSDVELVGLGPSEEDGSGGETV